VRKADRDSRRPGIGDRVAHGNGIAVATGDVSGLRDALAGLLGNEQLRRRMGEAADLPSNGTTRGRPLRPSLSNCTGRPTLPYGRWLLSMRTDAPTVLFAAPQREP